MSNIPVLKVFFIKSDANEARKGVIQERTKERKRRKQQCWRKFTYAGLQIQPEAILAVAYHTCASGDTAYIFSRYFTRPAVKVFILLKYTSHRRCLQFAHRVHTLVTVSRISLPMTCGIDSKGLQSFTMVQHARGLTSFATLLFFLFFLNQWQTVRHGFM